MSRIFNKVSGLIALLYIIHASFSLVLIKKSVVMYFAHSFLLCVCV
jgi:hypothetical protein